jgi:glutamyl-tRNA reductase
MSVFALGLNHTTAPLDLRGRFALAPTQLATTLKAFRARLDRVEEVAIVSTCNRTEVYVGAPPSVLDPALEWLADFGQVQTSMLRSHAYVLEGPSAARHAFRVASGLDSMVLGEPQILGQLKQAVREAGSAGTLGTTLQQMFQRSFAVAKQVRSSTEIGSHSISMAAAAVRLAAQLFEDLRQTRVLFVGAGEMIELAATHFAAQHPKSITVANRTLERGEKLADRFGAEAITLTELPERLAQFDIIVTCTASTLPIIGKGTLERVVKRRRHAPVFIADLAVPRDVEAEAARLDDVFLYSVDDLTEIVKDNLSIRREAVTEAERMIAEQTAHFLRWLEGRTVVPTIAALSRHHDVLRAAEAERARRLLANGASPEQALDALARGLTNKLLHAPLAALNAAGEAERAELIATLARVYNLQDDEPA